MMNQVFEKNRIFCVCAYLCAFFVFVCVWGCLEQTHYTRYAFVCARLHLRACIYAYRVYVKPTPINLWLLQNRSKQHDQESSCKWFVFRKVTRNFLVLSFRKLYIWYMLGVFFWLLISMSHLRSTAMPPWRLSIISLVSSIADENCYLI